MKNTILVILLFTAISFNHVANVRAYDNRQPMGPDSQTGTVDGKGNFVPIPETTSQPDPTPAPEKKDPDEALPRFFNVDGGLYRSAAPTTYGIMKELAAAGIKTVVDLRLPREKKLNEAETFKTLGVNYIARPMSFVRQNPTPYVHEIIDFIGDKNNWPLLVHCKEGKDRTGLIIGLYRVKNQGWAAADAWAEMRARGYNRSFKYLTRTFTEMTGYKPPGILNQ